ncbi:hypothetical protein VRRI112168_19910 [Vreelandella rituensis]|uniref:hypothetical protein n=1 Tax=Vreelandella rituensis TaxID=2282306 RepID=UPI001C698620|nr:hypothetical protein [Halomonas rituensis]
MTNIIDFKAENHLSAEAQLNAFLEWAKATLPKGIPDRVHASILWEDESWHLHGFVSCAFTILGSTRIAPVKMQPPFTDFAKAVLVYRRVYQTKNSVKDSLSAMRALEVALLELTGTRDVTLVSAAICNRACEHMKTHWKVGNTAYRVGKELEKIISLMRDKKMLKTNFSWTSPLKLKPRRTLKQLKADREHKLPSPEVIKALGEIFNNDLTSSIDIVVTSACALLLSTPSRIGELADVEQDCVVFKEDTRGKQRMFLRWYAEKINKPMLKPVVKPEMEPVVERAIALLKSVTDEGRAHAAFLEDYPDQFPPHEELPQKDLDDPLTYAEVCAALKISIRGDHSPRVSFRFAYLQNFEKRKAISPAARSLLGEIRDGWDTSQGKRIFAKGKMGILRFEFNDRCVITLRKLNILVREKYLSKHFPYTTPYTEGKARVKYRDALFTVRTGALPVENVNTSMPKGFGVEIAASQSRMVAQLSVRSNRFVRSIFERHGYPAFKVNTHSFRRAEHRNE